MRGLRYVERGRRRLTLRDCPLREGLRASNTHDAISLSDHHFSVLPANIDCLAVQLFFTSNDPITRREHALHHRPRPER